MAYKWCRLAAAVAILTGLFALVRFHRYDDHTQPATPSPGLTKPVPSEDEVDWSTFAYTQYVTNSAYLCNSVMSFEALHRLSSRVDRVMMYPSEMLQSGDDSSSDARLLIKARDEYSVKLVPIAVQYGHRLDQTWAESYTKLLAFNQTQYSRVLSIDSDSMLLQDMDELFLLPPSPVAMLPRAYWLYPDKQTLSSQLMLIQPSAVEFSRIMTKIESSSRDDYDMEIVNYLYRNSALIIPHRRYDMLTGEFRNDDHAMYLGSDREVWDPIGIYNELKLIHFSDWPLPKPWLYTPEDLIKTMQPKCTNSTGSSTKSAVLALCESNF
ncbi:N-acetylglucosaminyltransferase [Neonectria punicea]|uniref:N-acetylglucosaminyltransferase n=1 Tax=Neonectria punicea TaxID=979145 RepID=A0ABR1HP44_9HYPO